MSETTAAPSLWRCPWPGEDPLYCAYHDEEWGVVERDEQALFEKLLLDGFQAGLSWITILRKRARYREVFDGFDPEKIARYRPAKIAKLLADPGIVRNRQKVAAAVTNARAYLAMREQGQELSPLLWQFVGGKTKVHRFREPKELPAESDESRAMSKELKARGFAFVGPTILYAFMQAVGMYNDHLMGCFRYRAV